MDTNYLSDDEEYTNYVDEQDTYGNYQIDYDRDCVGYDSNDEINEEELDEEELKEYHEYLEYKKKEPKKNNSMNFCEFNEYIDKIIEDKKPKKFVSKRLLEKKGQTTEVEVKQELKRTISNTRQFKPKLPPYFHVHSKY